jgi:hypothetical protein
MWSCNPTPPIRRQGVVLTLTKKHRDNFPFTFTAIQQEYDLDILLSVYVAMFANSAITIIILDSVIQNFCASTYLLFHNLILLIAFVPTPDHCFSQSV